MFTLSPLPFELSALEPHISARTLEFHYGQHHQTYVDNLNKLIAGTDNETKSLEEIMALSFNQPDQTAIFNNAAQVYNHNFYWHSLSSEPTKPGAEMAQMVADSFGSPEAFGEQFLAAALTQFGSGWAWLVLEAGKLKIVKTANADNPLVHGQRPLLVIDVWEHAYYLDYQNRRADYAKNIIAHLLNWDLAETQFKS
ncbi:superoxide dismutase [Fe] [Candidatus Falkowbacteria bacterium CG_4_10_14_0_2_um_filter_41_15]|uniref:Superoxide dismutase n=4 Tax=Candidatus Falkowiibacteriota TaxID=1752728 RepID=A0A2G9ZNC6_9BACT|nr:MAG: superoxide dismutase [Candidatus Falkowbacteria bacterium CG1_02_41_21]PIP34662.1 MAG: superoxide dismutase [Fe] [Candidatus Falkowbacteria bacterium CG23_combo_of_CG06-09_8_20_14_all_41_10]PIZ10916.1 MAG: superoxide dismutase [Fe] [Candidatus Falkowbacteria bacterium CG_4_10_14_0_8_um_filter_41_36]PJA09963.1 MAG: superoxide dismutase [Fe] [Candidatus Falkowbacteria bacterium CG_4_10_14_0_2_um_filter_41_15]